MAHDLASPRVYHPPWKKVRLAIRVALGLVALVLGLWSAMAFQHKCGLGEKWFENNTPWALPLLYATLALIPHRLWLAALIVGLAFALATFALAPIYLAAIHPNGEG